MKNIRMKIWQALFAALLPLCLFTSFLGHAAANEDVGSTYVDPGATAADPLDGDLTSKITKVNTVNTKKLGTYTITYDVTNSAGETATPVVRTVKVVDSTKPVITLNGTANVTVKQGATYTDDGAKAIDNYDRDLTSKISETGSVDTTQPGTYTKTFNVSDSSGNAAAPVARTVVVSTADESAQAEDFTVTSPMSGSTVNVEAGLDKTTVVLTANAPENSVVSYQMDGVSVGSSKEYPYEVPVTLDMKSDGVGRHVVAAKAELPTKKAPLNTESSFSVVPAPPEEDADHNGIADTIFAQLSKTGDLWIGKSTEGVAVTAVRIGTGVSVVPMAAATAFVPDGVLKGEEFGIVILQSSDKLNAIVPPPADPAADTEALAPNGKAIMVSVLASSDGGKTLEILDDTRLKDSPIQVSMTGINADGASALVRPAIVENDEVNGLHISSSKDVWTPAPNVDGLPNLTVDVTAPSVVALLTTEETGGRLDFSGVAGALRSFVEKGRGGGSFLLLAGLFAMLLIYNRMKSQTPVLAPAAANRRESQRYKAGFDVSMLVEGPTPEDSQNFRARVRDISHSGLLMETNENVSLGQKVLLAIPTHMCPKDLALPSVLHVEAEAVRTAQGSIGFRFSEACRQMFEFDAFMSYIHATAEPLPDCI